MGKIKRVRNKLHQDAVKTSPEKEKTSLSLENNLEKLPALPLTVTSRPERKINPAVKATDVKVRVCAVTHPVYKETSSVQSSLVFSSFLINTQSKVESEGADSVYLLLSGGIQHYRESK